MTDQAETVTDSKDIQPKSRKKYKRNRRPRGEGSVRLKNGAWHLEYKDAEGGRKSRWLCDKDNLHFSATCPAVRELAAQKLKELAPASNGNGNGQKPDMRIIDFWEGVYLPWAREINPKVGEPNLRPSTVAGYEQVWRQHLGEHFAFVTLRAYETPTATEFLTSLAKTQGRNTINHVRSLMSGIFSHAVAQGYVRLNPITGASVLGKTARPAKTGHYSLRESLSILAALADYVECQLVMSLSFFWGLRPSEIRGLRWEDFCDGSSENCPVCKEDDWDIEVAHVHIRRAIDKQGNETGLKTDEAEQPLPLMIPIAMPLQIWREQCGNPTEGWLFENKNGAPTDLRDWVRTKIRPALATNKLKWKGLYAGRRGAATMLLQLTGNALASQQLLRHKPGSAVTARHYLKAVPEALLAGTKLVEDAVEKALSEPKMLSATGE
jgi:integrase